jgi:hypothetical protein
MDLMIMRSRVRRDLKDEELPQRFTDDDLDRAIARAVTELSKYCPLQQKTVIATVSGSYDLNISSLAGRLSVDRVEFPVDETPRRYIRFEIYQDILTLKESQGDGANCALYWTRPHILDESASTIPPHLEDLVALGATAYAALVLSQYATDKANYGGENVDRDYLYWARGRIMDFQAGLNKLKSKVRINQLYPEE